MEASTTIRKMMSGNKIAVPAYQRAYSWDTPKEKSERSTQTDVFVSDIEEYSKSNSKSAYYFGHFLFEERGADFNVIDGQQRLTTIVIFLSALFEKLESMRGLIEEETHCLEDMVLRGSKVWFSTVDYDDQLFKDYVIHRKKHDHNGLETISSQRIVSAFDFFKKHLSDKTEEYLTKMLSIISKATCTTHLVKDPSEAIQMFIFQNNRGKRPSNLEIVKAQFLYHVHLYGDEDKDALVEEIKNRFKKIYKSISSIGNRIDEDDVLLYTMRVCFNSLYETNPAETINKNLTKPNSIDFIKSFTYSLSASFSHLSKFFKEHERENFAIHSLVTLGGIAVALPFVIKAYQYNLGLDQIGRLCSCLESLVLRHRLIGTRADITARINDVFKEFTEHNKDISPIFECVDRLKTTDEWWWAYWNNDKLRESLNGRIYAPVARYLLWKYENYLKGRGKAGYCPDRFDQIKQPELEHIAPQKEPATRPHGYDEYDEEFVNQDIECLGNYLLISKSHNASIHNDPFPIKHKDYTKLEQQREIQDMVPDPDKGIWSKELIRERKDKIVRFIMDNF